MKFRCHDLRHHFASEFAQRTGDIAALQRILGHKTIAMTMRYSHLMTEHLHSAMRKHEAAERTNPGTLREDIGGKQSADLMESDPAGVAPTTAPKL